MIPAFEKFHLEESLYPTPERGEKKRYLLRSDHETDLVLMIWGQGAQTPIHDHAGSECWTTLVKGELLEKSFERSTLKLISETKLEKDCLSMTDKEAGVHQLINESSDFVYSLHLYRLPFSHCNVYLEAEQKWMVLDNQYDLLSAGIL